MMMTQGCTATDMRMRGELAHVFWNIAQNHHPMPQEFIDSIPVRIRYTLKRRQRFMFFTEFSPTWNGIPGAMP